MTWLQAIRFGAGLIGKAMGLLTRIVIGVKNDSGGIFLQNQKFHDRVPDEVAICTPLPAMEEGQVLRGSAVRASSHLCRRPGMRHTSRGPPIEGPHPVWWGAHEETQSPS